MEEMGNSMHHGAQTSASKMPSSGPYFPREEGKTSNVKSPCFLHFGDRPRTRKATSLSSVPWGCPVWGQWALWGSWLLLPSLLKEPAPWVPPPWKQAPCRPSRGAAAGRGPCAQLGISRLGGNLHTEDYLVPKLSPEVNCMDLGTVNKFHFSFPMCCQTDSM